MTRKRHLIVIALAAATAASALLFTDAGAWKCDVHPEQPTCTTTTGPPVTVNTTIVQSTTVPTTTASTTTTAPSTTTTAPPAPPEVSLNPPSIIKLAG